MNIHKNIYIYNKNIFKIILIIKGRNCAQKINEAYRIMQADMFNLYTALVEANGRRRNYSMGIIEGEKWEFGKCDVERKSRKVEPRV